jgi:hypothetical protein
MYKLNVSLTCVFYFMFTLLFYPGDAISGPELIGAPKCKACHGARTGDQWTIWTESAHARAFTTLASDEAKQIATDQGLGDPQQEDTCLRCHSTMASLGDDVVISAKGKYNNSEGVGCEACHGPGSDYKSKRVMEDPEAARAAGMLTALSAEACGVCHNPESPTFQGFEFEQRWAEIAHPVPAPEQFESTPAQPGAGIPDEITFESSVGNVLFPHAEHATDLAIECVECHHQIRAMDLDTPHPDYLDSSWINCKTCHDDGLDAGTAYYRCEDCHHSDPDNIADETLSSKVVVHKNCWTCHESGTGVRASEGCGDCHVKKDA